MKFDKNCDYRNYSQQNPIKFFLSRPPDWPFPVTADTTRHTKYWTRSVEGEKI